jgi:LmbE family N-acetylglucosaminyl deacetylase
VESSFLAGRLILGIQSIRTNIQYLDRQEVLGDLVWVIRKFRPDVIITRFNQVPGTTHGHHTASAILASEAMEQAGDPTKYPEQLTL